MAPAVAVEITFATPPSFAKSSSSIDTTLSFAMNPEMSEVHMRQSPNPAGRIKGTNTPAIMDNMLCYESVTKLSPASKLLRNHTTIVAMRITENALCRKSFAFSHSSWNTFLALGIL